MEKNMLQDGDISEEIMVYIGENNGNAWGNNGMIPYEWRKYPEMDWKCSACGRHMGAIPLSQALHGSNSVGFSLLERVRHSVQIRPSEMRKNWSGDEMQKFW